MSNQPRPDTPGKRDSGRNLEKTRNGEGMTEKTIQRGEELFSEGRLEEAEQIFRSLLEGNEGQGEACNNLGVIAFQRGKLEEAAGWFSRALARDLSSRETLLNLAETLRALGRLPEIVPTLEAFQRKNPGDEEIAKLLRDAKGSLPLVSVHMIVWNGETYIAEAVESVLNQTYPNIELVIVDDGSTDRTRAIVQGFPSDKIRYARKEHSGVAPTRNMARSLCRGDFIVFVDSDDRCEPRLVEMEVKTLLEHPDIDAVYTDLMVINEEGQDTKEVWRFPDYEPKDLISALFRRGQNVVPFPSLMIRRELSDRVGDCDENFVISFDSDYVARLARYGRFHHIDLPLYRYRRHSANISRFDKSVNERARSTLLMLNKMLSLFPREDLCPEVDWRTLAPGKADAEFNFYVASIFWNHSRSFFQSGCHRDLMKAAENHTRTCLEADPAHRAAKAMLEEIRILDAMESTGRGKPASGKATDRTKGPLRILFLADSRSTHTKRYVRFFRDRGHDVHLFDTACDAKDLEGITLHAPSKRQEEMPSLKTTDPFLREVAGLHRVIRDIQPQIMHGHYLNGWCWWGAFTGFQPFVTTTWGSDVFLDSAGRPFVKRVNAYCLRESRLVTADSMDLFEATAGLRGFRDGMRYVPFGIDTDFFRPGYDASDLAKRLGLNGSRVVLSPRQFKPPANIHVLIQAIPRILSRQPDTLFILKTYLTDDPSCRSYEDYLRRLIRENNIEKQVIILHDLPFEDMPLLYNLADVMVTLRDTDGSSCSMLEAMACKTPVVVSDIESMREWVKDRENGRVVNQHDPDAVAEAVLSILADGNAGRKFTDLSYSLVKTRADYRTNWAAVEEGYYELLDDPYGGVNGRAPLNPSGDLLRTGWRFAGSGQLNNGERAFSLVLNMPQIPMQDHLKSLVGLGKIAWERGDWEGMENHYVNALKLLHTFELDHPLTIRTKEGERDKTGQAVRKGENL